MCGGCALGFGGSSVPSVGRSATENSRRSWRAISNSIWKATFAGGDARSCAPGRAAQTRRCRANERKLSRQRGFVFRRGYCKTCVVRCACSGKIPGLLVVVLTRALGIGANTAKQAFGLAGANAPSACRHALRGAAIGSADVRPRPACCSDGRLLGCLLASSAAALASSNRSAPPSNPI